MSVTFINCFEVAPGADADFLARWQTVNAYMIRQPGYLTHALHRSLGDDAQYRFVNVVHWSNAEEFEAAHDDGFRALVTPDYPYRFVPALFEVIDTGAVSSHGPPCPEPAPWSAETAPLR
jgi:heme-degrading monooxygenase HmoA